MILDYQTLSRKGVKIFKTHLVESTLSRGKNKIANNVLLAIIVDNIDFVELHVIVHCS